MTNFLGSIMLVNEFYCFSHTQKIRTNYSQTQKIEIVVEAAFDVMTETIISDTMLTFILANLCELCCPSCSNNDRE